MKKHIANAITCLNVLAGSLSIIFTFQGNYRWAAYCIVIAAVFDFLDGFIARMLHAVSAIGKELDSLCDIVSFGVAPAMMAFHFMQAQDSIWCYSALLMIAFSALRLAMFNLDERQTSSFIGLPTPANAIFWAFTIVGLEQMSAMVTLPTWTIALGCLLFAYLLVSPLPMFSLKFKKLKDKDNALRYLFLIGCIILIIWLKDLGLAACILWYILLCLLNLIAKKS